MMAAEMTVRPNQIRKGLKKRTGGRDRGQDSRLRRNNVCLGMCFLHLEIMFRQNIYKLKKCKGINLTIAMEKGFNSLESGSSRLVA